jgi:heavy metal efflux system protein
MIDRIIRFSVYNRFIVLALCAVFAAVGWKSFQSLPIDALPDVTNVQVQINTAVEGLSPEETERSVTFPIENAMRGIAGVIQVRSLTRFNLSQVTVVFNEATDIYRARQFVAERLQSLAGSLPNGARPQPGPVSSGLGEIFHYAVDTVKPAAGAERLRQLMELRTLQEWHVKPRLLTVTGVADVNTVGGFERQFHVQPDPAKLARYGLRFDDVVDALERVNRNVGGGYVQQSAEQFLVKAVGVLRNEQDISGVPVKTLDNLRTVTVGDLAEVRLATELRSGAGLVHEAVVGTVMMLVGENSRTVARRVAERLDEIQQGLPEGYKVEALYDRSELVSSTIRTVEHNLVTGAALVVIILFLLIGNMRAALITAVTIPLSLLGTFIFMKKLGVSGNLMSLGALDFGIIVDGAVILLDHCVRVIEEKRRELGRALTGRERQGAVYKAAVEIRTAAGFGELIIVVVFLPIFALVGIEGKMFQPMAMTFIVAIITALALSFTMVPALASILLAGDTTDEEPRVMKLLRDGFSPILARALSAKRATLGIGAAATALGVVLYSLLGLHPPANDPAGQREHRPVRQIAGDDGEDHGGVPRGRLHLLQARHFRDRQRPHGRPPGRHLRHAQAHEGLAQGERPAARQGAGGGSDDRASRGGAPRSIGAAQPADPDAVQRSAGGFQGRRVGQAVRRRYGPARLPDAQARGLYRQGEGRRGAGGRTTRHLSAAPGDAEDERAARDGRLQPRRARRRGRGARWRGRRLRLRGRPEVPAGRPPARVEALRPRHDPFAAGRYRPQPHRPS